MTSPRVPQSSAPVADRVRLPIVTWVMFGLAVILLPFGYLTLYGAIFRSRYDFVPEQLSVGVLMMLVGTGALIGGLVLLGVRSVAQRHLDALQRAARAQ